MEFPRYESYKDSGLDWLGDIPSDWQLLKSKFLWREVEQRSTDGSELLLSVSQNAGIVPRGKQSRSDSLVDYKKCSEGDLVINIMLAWMGGLGVSEFEGIVSPAYCVYRLNTKNNSKYLGYLYQTPNYLSEFARRSTGVVPSRWRMYTEDFGQIQTILPPIEEQERIARFLDEKTAVIDTAIAKKERLIRLLEEQKQILVQTAVTRGLNPNAPTRLSGIDWIGDIPAHWEVKKIKYASEIFRGKFTHRPRNEPSLYDGKYPFIQTGDVARAGKFIKNYTQTLNEKGLKVSTLIPKGTVVITIAANIGDIAILGFDACFPDSVVGFQPSSEIERDFLYYVLSAMKQQFVSSTVKNTQMNLNVDRIGSNSITIPPIQEQKSIVQYIDSTIHSLNILRGKFEQQISILNEYRKILIAEAVTGKIKI